MSSVDEFNLATVSPEAMYITQITHPNHTHTHTHETVTHSKPVAVYASHLPVAIVEGEHSVKANLI